MALGDAPVKAQGPAAALGSEQAAGAAAAAAATAQLSPLQLVPKRKRSKPLDEAVGTMQRSETMERLMQECECRDRRAGCLTSRAGAGGTGAGARVDVQAWCPYYQNGSGQRRLYSYHDAPAVLRFNPHIRSGYRAGFGAAACARSILQLHNETGNIWSHLAPALFMLVLALGGELQVWQGAAAAYYANVLSIAACFLGSVAYHTLMAHHHHHDTLLKLDVCGILLVLVGGGHMVLWWGMACFPAARHTFALLYYACGAASVWAALHAKSALGRGLPMLGLLAIRLASHAARLVLEGGAPSPALSHYLWMEVCSLAGGLLNVLRIPERWLQPADPAKPAPCDYVFNSHQLMHVLVTAAMWFLHLGASQDYVAWRALLDGTARCPV